MIIKKKKPFVINSKKIYLIVLGRLKERSSVKNGNQTCIFDNYDYLSTNRTQVRSRNQTNIIDQF